MEILKKPQACMVHDRWSVISRAIFFLYRDLLLLETFAIMTYFSFSKILKKHDKVTGFTTRDPFMVNIVNKANFTNYPRLMEMISRCQTLYNEASEKLAQDLHEDERLFLDMVSEWNTRNRDADSIATGGSAEITEGLPSPRIFAATAASTSASAVAAAPSPRPPPPPVPLQPSNPSNPFRRRRSQQRILPLARSKRPRLEESSSSDDSNDAFPRPRRK
jgi:hypothetical protein